MSVVSLGSALGTLGPKNDMNEDINITDNELLPGLAIDSKLEPKVKGCHEGPPIEPKDDN